MLAQQRRELRGLNIDTAVHERMIGDEIDRLEDQTFGAGAAVEQKEGNGTKGKGVDAVVGCVVHEQAGLSSEHIISTQSTFPTPILSPSFLL